MSPQKHMKFPPLRSSPQQRLTYDNNSVQNDSIHKSGEEGATAASVQPSPTRKSFFAGSSYIYAGTGRKPQLLMHLESYVNKELHTISPREPKYQELKLQVYSDIFGCFIKEFKTYQPVLSAIKKEYENTLAYQQDLIRELEPLRSHLRLAREECERKVQARQGEEQAEIGALKREKQQLQRDLEAMREREKATQEVVEHLQYELSNQYLQYREERDARSLLIGQLSYLTSASVKEHPADENSEESKDPFELHLALKVCRKDLTKAQEELTRMKAEYWDVVPQRNWDALERTHKQTLLQLKMLQADFNQLKSEHDTLLELHVKSDMQPETLDSTTVQIDASVSQEQSQVQSNQCESGTLPVQESRAAPTTAFPLKSDEETNELVTSVQCEPDGSDEVISSQTLNSLLEESGVAASPPALDLLGENTE